MSYTIEHAEALAQVKEAGTAVTFTRTTQTHTASTDQITTEATTVKGFAFQRRNTSRYEATSVVTSALLTLMFVANTYGEAPEEGDTAQWGGVPVTVKVVEPFAPDGTAVFSYVTVSR